MNDMPKKKIPVFKSEEEEREYWATHDSTEFIDWSKARKSTLSNLKPSLKTISIRLPEIMIVFTINIEGPTWKVRLVR